MKKKRIIGISCAIMLTLAVISVIYYFMNVPMASISRNVLKGEQVAAECGITIDTANKISVSYVSTVNEGNLTIRLIDENSNTIKEFQSDTDGKEDVYLEAGKYSIRVESDFFKGNYRVKVYD